jgi:hypothetical protein
MLFIIDYITTFTVGAFFYEAYSFISFFLRISLTTPKTIDFEIRKKKGYIRKRRIKMSLISYKHVKNYTFSAFMF